MPLTPYDFDDKTVKFKVDDVSVVGTVRQLRGALQRGEIVEILDNNVIISPFCLVDEGHVVYFNVRTPVDLWGKCSGTGRRVVYLNSKDVYKLYDEIDRTYVLL